MKIKIEKLPNEKITDLGIKAWPIWTCGISEFDWEFDAEESCLLLEGEVEVSSVFVSVRFSACDYVVFPKGLKCRWKVTKPVRKHYSFS